MNKMYETERRSWLKHLDFIIWDLVAITLSFWLSFSLRRGIPYGLESEEKYRGFYLVFLGLYLIIVFFLRSYSNIVRRNNIDEILNVMKQNVALLGSVLAYLVFTKQSLIYSRLFLGCFTVLNLIFTITFRVTWKKTVRKKMKESDKLAHLLVITNRQMMNSCINKLNNVDYQSFQVSGLILLDEDKKGSEEAGVAVVSNKNDMLEYIRLNVVDQVLIQLGEYTEEINILIKTLIDMGVIVHINIEQFERLPHKQIGQLGDLSVITSSFQTASKPELFLKRTMDIAGAVVGLAITGIAFIFVAPLIYMKSPGPIFFSQVRIGKNGRRFTIYKFRSMYMDAEKRKKELMEQNKMQGFMFKMDNDPRIIQGIGHFIRNTSIDELPQFWNVLKGDMSLVGTRPPTVDEFEQYNYHHKIRLSFRPGLTGMWQANGRSDITDFEEVVRLDEQYIAEWSIWLDIKLILKTIQVVLQRKGSE